MPEPTPRILLVRLSSFGDILFITPALRALRTRHPQAQIDAVVYDRFEPVLAGHPELARLLVLPKAAIVALLRRGRLLAAWRRWRSFRRDLRAVRYDWAVDLHGVTDSALVTLAARAAHRAGPRLQPLSLFMEKRTGRRRPEPIHEAWRALLALAACGLLETTNLPLLPEPEYHPIDTDGAARQLAACGLAERPFIALFPGASQPWKTWPTERFAELAVRLGDRCRLPLVLLGGTGDAAAVAALRERCPGETPTMLGLPLPVLAGIIKRATLLIGNDTGPLHLATALGVPTVVIYGPVDFLRFHPLSDRAWPVVPQAPCLPCTPKHARRCHGRTCLVATDAAFAACREALDSVSPQSGCACRGLAAGSAQV